MIKRYIRAKCVELLRSFPVITITGPRQSGKTTLSKQLLPDKPYFNLEEMDIRRHALDDPRSFLGQMPEGGIIDEIQRAPDLPSYIQGKVDASGKNGLFVLTGSQNLEVTKTVSQSLAGRTAELKLLPFDNAELSAAGLLNTDPDQQLFKGFYPRLYSGAPDQMVAFYMGYYENYVERDIRSIMQIENLRLFDKFVRLLAARTGQLLNLSNIANDAGVSQPTLRRWLSALEAGFIVFQLMPFHANLTKRLIKTPKVYFYDTGLLCFLLGITEKNHLSNHPLRGSIFENMIIADKLKRCHHAALPPNLFFFRDRAGLEVDLIVDKGGKLTPVEIKSATTWNPDSKKALKAFSGIMPGTVDRGFVVYAGDQIFESEFSAIPWQKAFEHF